jgi:hypothetical protein
MRLLELLGYAGLAEYSIYPVFFCHKCHDGDSAWGIEYLNVDSA